jgi:L-glyceraldehyde 3-phosphate reductase
LAADTSKTRELFSGAFDLGITHLISANNYGPPPGSAEEMFAAILKKDLHPYRDELIISTKAGYYMWPGPYGEWGSRKYLIASLDQSLKRMGLDYVDIFYHHRPDPDTPLEETMAALDHVVRQGKALYVGISNYRAAQSREAARILRDMGTPCLINQVSYSMFNRWVEGIGRNGGRDRDGSHLLFAAGAGPADRPLSARHSRRFACGQAGYVPEKRADHRHVPGEGAPPE